MYVFFRINVRILYAFMYFQRDVCTLQRGVCILDACTYFSQRYTCCRLLFVFYKYMYVFCIMYVFEKRHTYSTDSCTYFGRDVHRVAGECARDGGGRGRGRANRTIADCDCCCTIALPIMCSNALLCRLNPACISPELQETTTEGARNSFFLSQNMPGTDSPQTGHLDCAHHRDNAHG